MIGSLKNFFGDLPVFGAATNSIVPSVTWAVSGEAIIPKSAIGPIESAGLASDAVVQISVSSREATESLVDFRAAIEAAQAEVSRKMAIHQDKIIAEAITSVCATEFPDEPAPLTVEKMQKAIENLRSKGVEFRLSKSEIEYDQFTGSLKYILGPMQVQKPECIVAPIVDGPPCNPYAGRPDFGIF